MTQFALIVKPGLDFRTLELPSNIFCNKKEKGSRGKKKKDEAWSLENKKMKGK